MSMSVTYSKLFERGRIGNLEIKNRVVFAPISTNLASVTGEVSEKLIQHYYKVAKGGAGLIIVENTCVQFPEGRHGAAQPRIDSDDFVPGLYHLAQAIKQAGAKACIELAHPGGVADPKVIGRQPVAPSSVPMKTEVTPRELTKNEIEKTARAFGMVALRAKKALFDMVEVQAGHGLLINQFLSPLTNKRNDEFGGNLENRMRFAKMVIEKIKEYAGDGFPISVRLGVEEFTIGGITIDEGKVIAKELADAGADTIHVTVGNTDREKRLEPIPYLQGWRTCLAEQVKKEVNVPVITVGVIREPWFAEKILEEGKADFVALGRALIADPEWPKKALKGEEKAVRRCISCNECVIARHYEELPIRCSINPSIGLDEKLTEIKKAKIKKKVMIIGAGPAGMEAARVSALRGHEVHLYEENSELGGTLNIASIIPGKEKLKWVIEYYAYELPRLGVHTHLGCVADKKEVEKLKPDIVIVASGAKPTTPNIPSVNNSNVVFAHDILKAKVKIEKSKVTIIGGGLIGLETAEFLASKNNEVTVVKRYETISRDIEPIYAQYLFSELKKLGVNIMVKAKVKEIRVNCVTVEDDEGKIISIPADWVVIARGLRPFSGIAHELNDYKAYLIGDCLEPRRIYNAIFEGYMTARQI